MSYIPNPDAEFNEWQARFVPLTDDTLGTGVAALSAELVALSTSWETNYQQHIAAQDVARSKTVSKDEARAALTALIRTAAQLAQSDPTVTEEARTAAGLPVRKTGGSPVPTPTTRPVPNIDTSQRLTHIVHFRDENSTGKAKPAGVSGCEIWVKVGDAPPASADELHFLGLDTRTPYTAQYDFDDGGKTAYYMLRWVNTRGESGPWSETAEATIGG